MSSKALREFATKILREKEYSLGHGVPVENLLFIPILKQSTSREERDYLTVDEALNENLLEIIDKGIEIEHIIVKNHGDFPVLIEEGEIFEGLGTQDRVAVGSVVIQSRSTIELPVKCIHAPHPLAFDAQFSSWGKSSRHMLRHIRNMKMAAAKSGIGASRISQAAVWDDVVSETDTENVSDSSKYKEAMDARSRRVAKRNIEFPDNTIGLIAISEQDKLVGMEIHRNPRAFNRRKTSVLVSLEKEMKEDTKPIPEEQGFKKGQEILQQLAKIDEEDIQHQVEVDGLLLDLTGEMQGEFVSNKFYSSVCPECGQTKPRIAVCGNCGFVEEAMDEFLYASFS